jgi:putative endonuclease
LNPTGQLAEDLAAGYLKRQGLKLISSNYRCRFGEIDLIMQDGQTLVFVEVRMRSNPSFGSAAESITPAKQKKLTVTAQHYMQQHGEKNSRFDAVIMSSLSPEGIEWLRNAF